MATLIVLMVRAHDTRIISSYVYHDTQYGLSRIITWYTLYELRH